MILGLIGDVHQEHDALARALDRLGEVDLLLCTGDVVDGEGRFSACVELLHKHEVRTVRGNHDRWLLQDAHRGLPHATPRDAVSDDELAWLEALPVTLEIDTPRGTLLLCHGAGHDDMSEVSEDTRGYDLEVNDALQHLMGRARRRELYAVVGGHKHRAFTRYFEELLWVNPGTLKRDARPGVARWDLEAGVYTRFTLP